MVKMNTLKVAQLKSLPPGKHCDGRGLWLHKRPDGAQWVYRFNQFGRTREMGLGSLRDIGLADARDAADAARQQVRAGLDPIRERRLRTEVECRRDGRLAELAQSNFAAHKHTLKSAQAAERWHSPLRLHVLPKLGKVPVVKLDQHDIVRTLKPIWHQKNVTARKAMSRLTMVLRHAIAQGFEVDLRIIEHARILLGDNLKPAVSIKSLHYLNVPDFYLTLNDTDSVQLALRMLILTGVRSDAVNNMRFDQIENGVWTIPKAHVKGRLQFVEDFKVPLSAGAKEVIACARRISGSDYLFCNSRGGPLDKMAMRNWILDQGIDAKPHGFRSSFRTWIAEQTDAQHEVAEACICHLVKSSAEKAYNKSAYFPNRVPLMTLWSDYLTQNNYQFLNAA